MPPLPNASVPVIPVVNGSPVRFVATPLDGVPSTGVTNVGDVPKTSAPLPVSSVTIDARFALDGVARNVAAPVPSPDTPVEIGNPVALVNVPLAGTPNAGVTNVGEVANASAPDPVSSVTAVARLALDGVARNVPIPVPSPDTPVDIGKPVALVRVADVGVPRIGVTNVGDVARATFPEPVELTAVENAPAPSLVRN